MKSDCRSLVGLTWDHSRHNNSVSHADAANAAVAALLGVQDHPKGPEGQSSALNCAGTKRRIPGPGTVGVVGDEGPRAGAQAVCRPAHLREPGRDYHLTAESRETGGAAGGTETRSAPLRVGAAGAGTGGQGRARKSIPPPSSSSSPSVFIALSLASKHTAQPA